MREPFWLSRAEVRDVDRIALDDYGMPGIALMENAGRGVAELLLRLNHKEQPIHILCGPGNNGGDGFVIARHLQNAGTEVNVWLFATPAEHGPKLSPDAAVNYRIWTAGQGACTHFDTSVSISRTYRDMLMQERGWIVDALFGTGLTRPLESPFAELVGMVNAAGRPVVAVDIPSGLDCDTGQPNGPTIRAKHTATFVALKLGFRNSVAWPWLGKVHVLDIGAPRHLVEAMRALPDETHIG